MPKLVKNLLGGYTIDYSEVQKKESESIEKPPMHNKQTAFDFNPNPTLFK